MEGERSKGCAHPSSVCVYKSNIGKRYDLMQDIAKDKKIDFKKAEQNILEDLWSEAKKKEVKK